MPKARQGKQLSIKEEKFVENMANIYGIRKFGEAFCYIGSTVRSLDARFRQHLSHIRHGKHANKRLQNYIAAEGVENFEIVFLSRVPASQRLISEYERIAALESQGVKLLNVVASQDQSKYFISTKAQNFTAIPLTECIKTCEVRIEHLNSRFAKATFFIKTLTHLKFYIQATSFADFRRLNKEYRQRRKREFLFQHGYSLAHLREAYAANV